MILKNSSQHKNQEHGLTVNEALGLVAEALDYLHDSNLYLQERIGSGLSTEPAHLIEDLQILDRQGQVTMDVSKGVRQIARVSSEELDSKRFNVSQLFSLDATHHALATSKKCKPAADKEHPDDYLF